MASPLTSLLFGGRSPTRSVRWRTLWYVHVRSVRSGLLTLSSQSSRILTPIERFVNEDFLESALPATLFPGVMVMLRPRYVASHRTWSNFHCAHKTVANNGTTNLTFPCDSFRRTSNIRILVNFKSHQTQSVQGHLRFDLFAAATPAVPEREWLK